MKLHEIFEAIDYSRCDNIEDKYDRDLCNWFHNEIPLGWSAEEIAEVRSRYGNVDIGIVYRGIRIDTEELYEQLKSKPKSVNIRLGSSSPNKVEAQSFALYVKSYDEMTMLDNLRFALRHGSAGQFGTALLVLKPKPEQVIARTFSVPSDPKDLELPSGAEEEAILYGDIEIVDVIIYERLTTENWQEEFLKLDAASINNNNFFMRWLNHQKISDSEMAEFVKKYVEKATEDDLFNIVIGSYIWESAFKIKKVQDFIKKHHVVDDEPGITYKGKFYTNHNLKQAVLKMLNPSDYWKILSQQIPEVSIKREKYGVYIDYESDKYGVMNTVTLFFKNNPELRPVMRRHPSIKMIIKGIDETAKLFKNLTVNDVVEMQRNLRLRSEFSHILNSLKGFIFFHPNPKGVAQDILRSVYYLVGHGKVDDDKQKAIDFMKKMIPVAMEFFSYVNQASKDL